MYEIRVLFSRMEARNKTDCQPIYYLVMEAALWLRFLAASKLSGVLNSVKETPTEKVNF